MPTYQYPAVYVAEVEAQVRPIEGFRPRRRLCLKPQSSAVEMAAAMGIDLLTEDQYRELQKLGEFDTKTSSWIKTPPDVRSLAEPSSATVAMARYSCITMARVVLRGERLPRLASRVSTV